MEPHGWLINPGGGGSSGVRASSCAAAAGSQLPAITNQIYNIHENNLPLTRDGQVAWYKWEALKGEEALNHSFMMLKLP